MNFRKSLTALTAAAGLFGGLVTANAADMSRPVYKAPVDVPAFNWTGFYIGAVTGYGWGESDLGTAGLVAFRTNPDGWLAGGTVGYNYQQGNLMLGTEGEFYWSNVDGSSTIFAPGGSVTGSYSNNWTGTLSTRLGVAFDTILFYSKAGVAWANNDYTFNFAAPAGAVALSTSKTETGWLVGAGVEWAFARNWSAKIEGTYMDFGSRGREFDAGLGIPLPFNVDSHISTVKLGINYRFY